MNIQQILENGENSYIEFKEQLPSPPSLAEEVVAFLNVRGGSIFLGVSDEGTIVGLPEEDLKKTEERVMNICRNNISPPVIPEYEKIKVEGKWIVKISFPEGLERPYQTIQGKYLVRAGTTKRLSSREELLRLFQNASIHHIDDRPVLGTSEEDLNLDKLAQYFRTCYEIKWNELTEEERQKLLLNASLVAEFQGKRVLSLVGVLFFSKGKGFPMNGMERCLSHAAIQFVSYVDDSMEEIADRYDCFESSPDSIDSIVHKIRLNWKNSSVIKGLQREETPFPEKVFRELLVNAVLHRDYSIHANIQVKMFPKRIEIISPGKLVNSVTLEKMKTGISVPRNPILLKFMQNYRYADHLGRGIPMALRRIREIPELDLHLEEKEDLFEAKVVLQKISAE